MPIYEYVCQDCGSAFEALVNSSKVKSACPECGSKVLTRRFSTFAAHGGEPKTPCRGGTCPLPAEAQLRDSCAGGKCPFS
jgi:putative FmdB family regulatory protein